MQAKDGMGKVEGKRWVRGLSPCYLEARGGVARIVKKMIIGMTLTIHIFAQIEYIWALKNRSLHLQKMH